MGARRRERWRGEVHLGFPVGLERVKGDIEEGFAEMFAISSAEIVYSDINGQSQFLDLICCLHEISVTRERQTITFLTLASSRISVENPIDYYQVRYKSLKDNTSPPASLIDLDTLSSVPCDLANNTTLYSCANRLESEAPNPGPTPAITASPML